MQAKFNEIPSTENSNYLIFSMHSLAGIAAYLDDFPDGISQMQNKGCSATLIWSGIEGKNTPVSTYSTSENPYRVGFVLNPELLNTPQADLYARNSGGMLQKELCKKDAFYGEKKLVTNDPDKAGYYRDGGRHPTFTTNLAKHEKLAKGKSVYHPEGRHDILAKNIWRKYFHKPGKYMINHQLMMMKYNEVICYEKSEFNPICGLLVSQEINQATAKTLLAHFETNPHLKLYFYNFLAKEHIVRWIDNAQAIAYLKAIVQRGQTPEEFNKAFAEAQKFQGYDTPYHSRLPVDSAVQKKAIESFQNKINCFIEYGKQLQAIDKNKDSDISAFGSSIEKFGHDSNNELEIFKKAMNKANFKTLLTNINNYSSLLGDTITGYTSKISHVHWLPLRGMRQELLSTLKKIAPLIPASEDSNNPLKPTAPPLPARKVASVHTDVPQIPVPELKKTQRPPAVLPVQPQKIMKADAPKKSVPANKKEPIDKGWTMLEDSQSLGEQGLFKPNKEDIRANNRRIIIKKVLEGMEKYQAGDDTNPFGVNRCKSLRALLRSEVNPHLKIMAIIAVLDGDKKEDALVGCIKEKLDKTGDKRLNYLNNQALSIAKEQLKITTPAQLQDAKSAILGKIDDGIYSKMNKIEDNDVLPPADNKHFRL